MTDILHISTVHSRQDTRIFYKMLCTLAAAFPGRVGFGVFDGKGDAPDVQGVAIHNIGPRPRSRISRILKGNAGMFRLARRLGPKIVHFHDPELLPCGLALRMLGYRTIYDVHEDVPRQLREKSYIRSAFLRGVLSRTVAAFEAVAARCMSAVVASVPEIAERFPAHKSISVRNFPRHEIIPGQRPAELPAGPFTLIYAGALSEKRGILDVLDALALLPDTYRLRLLGSWNSESFRQRCEAHPAWSRTEFLGRLPHDQVFDCMIRSDLGLQMTWINPNNTGLATKVFEYVFCKLPVMITDTPDKRRIYAGLAHFAPASDPEGLARAIEAVAADYPRSLQQAQSAYDRAVSEFSWAGEGNRLIDLYKSLLAE